MGPNSLKTALARWNIDPRKRWDDVLADFPLDVDDLLTVADEISRIGGERSENALGRLIDVYGVAWVYRVADNRTIVTEAVALKAFEKMRNDGEVTRPREFLSRMPASEEVNAALSKTSQELLALNGEITIEFSNRQDRYERNSRTSLYLLHNSLPFSSGGYSTRTHGLLTGLRTHGVEAIPVTRPGFPSQKHVFDQIPDVPSFHVVDGIPYHHLVGTVSSQPRSDLQGFVDLYADLLDPLVRRYRPSVIHAASNWWNGFAVVATARRYGIPAIYEIRGLWEVTRASRQATWQDSERYAVDVQYERAAASLADRVIVITEGLRDEMVSRGIDEDKITVVPNAVNLDNFTRREKDTGLAKSLGIDNTCVVGFAGSLTFYEGLDDLLAAGARLRGETAKPFTFLIVGDGAVKSELENLAIELGIADICRFTGRVPHSDVNRYLSIMDISPFPRIPIPVCEMVSPLKPLESMATGVAVLASDVQALKEMVPPGIGLTFEKGNLESLTERLGLMIDDEELRDQLAESAYEWVRANRSWAEVSKLITALYDELEV